VRLCAEPRTQHDGTAPAQAAGVDHHPFKEPVMHTFPFIQRVALLVACAPLLANAQSNEAFVEKAKIVGGGNVIRLYGLPAKDANGKLKYWDTTITLEIGSTGKPAGNSATVSVPQAKANSTEFVPGAYADAGNGYSCNLLNSAFNGRTQFDLHCTSSSGYTYTATWFTGPIAGHPWEVDLVAAKLDTLPGHDEYAWGRTMYDSGVTFFGCFNDPELLSARQVGNTLSLVNYGSNEVIDCQFTLFKQP
jgi:hypothetical protein